VSAVGHYLEQAGIPTVQISLIREHTEALSAPRALWVPFMLGRPLGAPNDVNFQTRVLKSALDLITRLDGPVLEDFQEEAPPDSLEASASGLVCPISFPKLITEGSMSLRIAHEIEQLQAWHTLSLYARKKSKLGITGRTPSELGAFLASWLDSYPMELKTELELEPFMAVKFAADELKIFYYEAKAMQPSRHSAKSIEMWFWFETTAGDLLIKLREKFARDGDPAFAGLAALSLVPRTILTKLSETR
jgi:hypothetical protein